MTTQTSHTVPPVASTRHSIVDTALVARRAAARAARTQADCIADARAVRRQLATVLAATLRRTRGLGASDALIVCQMTGVHQEQFWAALGAQAGVRVPASADARRKVIALAREIAAGREGAL